MPRRTKNAAVAALESVIESHVASRIRLRRGLLGMSQSDLARTLGITFQQVQKYERGSNRVSVGKLYRLAEILDVPLTFFFDGLDLPDLKKPPQTTTGFAEQQSPILSRRELDLLRAWKNSPPEVSDAVASLLRAIAPYVDEDAADAERPADDDLPAPLASDDGDEGEDGDMGDDDGDEVGNASPAPSPRPRGRKPAVAVTEDADKGGRRRRRNAVWDPSDIEKASRGASRRR
ncbi:helix-turn-helix domain-containing protein [Rhodospirillum centenum]|uniref:DNA-binding protein, putative n=1 Tax=Rhodospirillum centenum (strain ATCC 51521 / SW) TaxID=414684 RepID=B6IN19_RHOCS|nr:helix-turn-helix transcriptional regulator [Rhodospirillum centenum]ACI98916.1 DNA-binding protein, putative [Rhodospirillum centenum SW]